MNLIDDRVEKNLKDTLGDLLAGLNFRFVDYAGLGLSETIKKELAIYALPLRLRMTRLDSDDLVASDFFARIEALKFSDSDIARPTVMSFPG